MFDTISNGIRQWLVELFAGAIKRTSRPEERQAAILWLLRSREILKSRLGAVGTFKNLYAELDARATVKAMMASVADAVRNYKSSNLPWPMKIALPVTLAAIPVVGGHGAGVAAFGSAIGLPVLLLVFLGTAGVTAIIEAVVVSPHSRAGVAIIVAGILQSEAARRATATFRRRMADEAASPQATAMPEEEMEIQAMLLRMDPFDFEKHVMAYFEKAGLPSVVTPKSKDFGMDGYAQHDEGLIVVQCKRYASDNKVGFEPIQRFK